jgi:hypothetical protein
MSTSLPVVRRVFYVAFLAFVSVILFTPLLKAQSDDVTTIRLTENVLVEDTMRLGVNLGGDAYYSGAALVKLRTRENFEGTMYRRCDYGPGVDETGVSTWFSPRDPWRELIIGGRYTILSGPSKGMTGIVQAIETREYMHEGRMKPFDHYVLDKPLELSEENVRVGIMLERDRTSDGTLGGGDGYWSGPANTIEIGDTADGSFGVAALRMNGTDEKAHHRFSTHYQRYGETNGVWTVRFRAKRAAGSPLLTVQPDRYSPREPITQAALRDQWTQHELTFTIDQVPEPTGPSDNPHLLFLFETEGGDALIDDVEIQLEGDENPTAFRDDVVEMLKRYNPGAIRKLQMGGSTLDNTLRGPMQSFAYSSQGGAEVGPKSRGSRDPYGLHEMYELCEYVDSNPWYTLPGTLTQKEMSNFLEYLGAPSDVGYGRIRAELGHPQPWTEVFETIHVELGNEAWNNAGPYQCGGFNGPDYWADIFALGKASPYYQPNIVFHAAGQGAHWSLNEGIMRDCPTADRFSVAPYIIQGFDADEYDEYLDTPEKFFRWAFAWPVQRSRHPDGAMLKNFQNAEAAGLELSIYEMNHHTTHGDGPLEPRNDLVTSIGGGMNVANNMLLMLKEHHLRTQCLFSLIQHGYNAHGVGEVRLWGTALCMREGQERYRPTFLACATANRVLGGDLIETVHEGANPTFSATGIFNKYRGVETSDELPVLWSYAFKDGKRRGLILLNLDVTNSQPVRLALDAILSDTPPAVAYTISADEITANNEYESGDPQVEVRRSELQRFRDGYGLTLPPHSMLAISWEVK